MSYYKFVLTTFIELEKPKEHGAFGWYVIAADEKYKKKIMFLATDSTVQVRTGTEGFFFDTEVDAHTAASKYYSQHGMMYPYTPDWHDAILSACVSCDGVAIASTTIQSEEMFF